MSQSRSNHSKAPVCAAFVKDMREAFGDVHVLYVKEGEFELGEPDKTEYGYFVLQGSVKKNAPTSRRHAESEEEA